MHFISVLRNYILLFHRNIDCEDGHDHHGEDLSSDAVLLSKEQTSENLHDTRVVYGPHFAEVTSYMRWNKSSQQ